MRRIVYDKLVRDRIPEIIETEGKIAETSFLTPEQMGAALDAKLHEEVEEFFVSHDPEEIADILEVLHAIADERGFKWEDIESAREGKRSKRGGFKRRIFLHAVETRAGG